MGRVLAVPDPRTSAIIVMASKTMMPQIEDMIKELDSDKGRKEVVGFFDLQNADPQDVYNNLQDLFQRNNVRQQNNNPNPMLGSSSPLYQREKNNHANYERRDLHRVWRKFRFLSQRQSRWRLLNVDIQHQQQLG